MTVLDLGCGEGQPLTKFKLNPKDKVIGVDIVHDRVLTASKKYPERHFLVACGERVPLATGSVDRVVANVSLPYMRLPVAAQEVRRVLRDGGTFSASLHPWRFTVDELLKHALPRPKATLYRLSVLASGLGLHFTGRAWSESCQTRKGITRSLRMAGFSLVEFSYYGTIWLVNATK